MTEQLKTNLTQTQLDQLAKMITLEEDDHGNIRLKDVRCNVYSNIFGSIHGDVYGDVMGDVEGSVWGRVYGGVWGDV